jgi:fructosamine-3-kinase
MVASLADPMTDFASIAEHIAAATGCAFEPAMPETIGGGCINSAVRLSDEHAAWFVKLNRANMLDMFEAEHAGLTEMADTHTIRVPRPLCTGTSGSDSYIVMEYIAPGRAGPDGQCHAGEQLAAMHRHQADRFGWHRDNTIGATPQHNDWRNDWARFFRDQRLGFQLELAARNGHRGRLQRDGELLLDSFHVLLDHAPTPSLLHGDLWGGNMSFDSDGSPVIYDPATYYGDREADLAMTELFGGFGRDFYAAYDAAWPLDPGYRVRKTLYNLYHILNHLNLFGGGYAGQAHSMIEQLLAQCR